MKDKPVIKALIFDFDGVILESVNVKTDVFRALFKRYPTHIPAIVRYHLKNSGVNRLEKFDYIYKQILHRPLSTYQKNKLAKDFSTLVIAKVLSCRFVPGALSLLKAFHKKIPLFVISATPEKELKRIVRRRKLKCFFKRVYGFPTSKAEAIKSILLAGHWLPKEALYVGDSRADWQAARQTGVQFIGRIYHDQKQSVPKSVPCICNFANSKNIFWQSLHQSGRPFTTKA